MTGDDELRARLEDWGSQETPPPDAAFSEALEQDLRSAIHFRPSGAPGPARRFGFRPGALFRPGIVFAALLLVAGVAFLLTRGDEPDQRVAIESADDTELTFADGSTALADAGRELPDGTRIDVGPDGSAVIDDVVLGAGDVAVIVDGIVEVITDAPPTPLTDQAPTVTDQAPTVTDVASPTVTDVAPTPTSAPVVTDRPTTAEVPTPTTVTDQRPTPQPVGTPEREPTPEPTKSEGDPTPEPSKEPTPETTPMAAPLTVELTAEPLDGDRLRLSWTANTIPDALGGWEVIALVPDGTRTIAVVRNVEETELTVSGRASGYQVLARRVGGEILAESNVWQVTD